MKSLKILIVCFLGLSLAACGGGGDMASTGSDMSSPVSKGVQISLEPLIGDAVITGEAIAKSSLENENDTARPLELLNAPTSVAAAATTKITCYYYTSFDFDDITAPLKGSLTQSQFLAMQNSYYKIQKDSAAYYYNDLDNMLTAKDDYWRYAPGYDYSQYNLLNASNSRALSWTDSTHVINIEFLVEGQTSCPKAPTSKMAQSAGSGISASGSGVDPSNWAVSWKQVVSGGAGLLARYGLSAFLHWSYGPTSFDNSYIQSGINGVSACTGFLVSYALEQKFDGKSAASYAVLFAGFSDCVKATLSAAPYATFVKWLKPQVKSSLGYKVKGLFYNAIAIMVNNFGLQQQAQDLEETASTQAAQVFNGGIAELPEAR